MEIRLLTRDELSSALELVWKVFCEYEAVNYTETSKQVFYDAIHSKEYLDMLTAYGAFDGDEPVGIIASRNEGSHIALFFVEGAYHRQGIGRMLWETMLENSTADIITVHSSLYASEVYKRLGFKQTGEETTDGGIVYIPMEYHHFMDISGYKESMTGLIRKDMKDLKEFR
ncbi:MAG: GNAT family N-acetyltransferase [Mogibacterium sp.]|nr:GNAT family N-acetyltransferase [Mogibacterium sp.]